MRTGKGRRWAALLLCLAMMFSTIGSASPGDSAEPSAGLCEHHPEHTAECGYIAPSAGSPCRHVHDESCGYAEAAAETPCDMGCTDTDGDGVIDHAEGCAYTPGSAGSPCGHVHDESCGYAEATAGSPCQFVCDICNAAAAPEATEAPADSPAPEEPSDTPAPTETPAPAEAPAPIGDPGMEGPGLDEPAADGDIMLTALTDPVVTVKKSGDVADPGTGIESNTPCEMEHNQVYQLNVTANYSGVTNGKVKITVAPGLKINSYYQDTSATIDAVKATHSNPEITNYTLRGLVREPGRDIRKGRL